MRRTVVLLLLAAALVHPVLHAGPETLACACAHGIDLGIAPQLPETGATEIEYVAAAATVITVAREGAVPARAPPAA